MPASPIANAANRHGKSILISGMGIAGPTLAYWLLRHNFQPVLVEQAPHVRAGGYVVDFWGLGYDIAERMGLLGDLKLQGYRVTELRLVNDRGRRIGGFGVDVFRTLTEDRYTTLPRGDLARLVQATLAGRCETIFGDSIENLVPDGDGVVVRFAQAGERRFDLVVGADGLHSNVRALAFGPQEKFEMRLGFSVAAFEAQNYRPRDENVYVSYSLPGRQISRFALRNDSTLFLFVFADGDGRQREAPDLAARKQMLHRAYDDGGWECRNILAALDDCRELYFDGVSQIRMDAWSQGRIVLIGDAAFCPSLLAGQGAALAMTAAYVLAGEIARSQDDLAAACRRYDAMMRNFIVAKQNAARRIAASFAPRTRLGLFVRNQVTKVFSIPQLAKLTMGASLVDRLALPDYG